MANLGRGTYELRPPGVIAPVPLPVTFLTDYGYGDEFAGACRAVIARLAPEVRVIDLTHGIGAGDVRRGALALAAAAPHAGPAVHLAVVDPGVGTARRALALRAGESFLVGPDNGLLQPSGAALGGIDEAFEVGGGPLRLEPVAPTFHGRDVFAPVAAHLAGGGAIEATGERVDPATVAALELPEPRREGRALVTHVLYTDRFGNLILDARLSDLGSRLNSFGGQGTHNCSIEVAARGGSALAAVAGATFADGSGGLVLLEDSSGWLALALDGGSAADLLGVGRDDELTLREV